MEILGLILGTLLNIGTLFITILGLQQAFKMNRYIKIIALVTLILIILDIYIRLF